MELDQAMRKMNRTETDKCQRPEAFPNFVNCLMMINQSQGHFAGQNAFNALLGIFTPWVIAFQLNIVSVPSLKFGVEHGLKQSIDLIVLTALCSFKVFLSRCETVEFMFRNTFFRGFRFPDYTPSPPNLEKEDPALFSHSFVC